MALSAKMKRAKVEADLFSKELQLMGYRAHVPQKRNSTVLVVRFNEGILTVEGWRGRWYLRSGSLRGFMPKTVASANKLDQIFVKTREWLVSDE